LYARADNLHAQLLDSKIPPDQESDEGVGGLLSVGRH
jgi:hypothetical protein